MSPNDLERLLPCPFCGGGTTEFRNNGQVWVGTKYSDAVSVSVRHWCEESEGPSRMIERVGRDKEQAIERWNMRAQTAPSVPAPIEGAKYMSNDWYYAEGWNDCRHAMLDAQPAPSVPDGWIDPNDKTQTQTRYLPHIGEPVLFRHGNPWKPHKGC